MMPVSFLWPHHFSNGFLLLVPGSVCYTLHTVYSIYIPYIYIFFTVHEYLSWRMPNPVTAQSSMFKPEPKYTHDTNVNRLFQQHVPCFPKISQSTPWKMNSSPLKKKGWKMNTFLLWPCNFSGTIPGCVRKLVKG